MLWEYLLGETVIKASYIRTSVSLDGMACRPPPLSTEPGEQQVPGKCSCTPPPPAGGPLLVCWSLQQKHVSPRDLGLHSQIQLEIFKNYHQN